MVCYFIKQLIQNCQGTLTSIVDLLFQGPLEDILRVLFEFSLFYVVNSVSIFLLLHTQGIISNAVNKSFNEKVGCNDLVGTPLQMWICVQH